MQNLLIIQRGSIYHWQNYEFEDGKSEPKDKYWLSLTCKVNEFPMYIILPTSRIQKYLSGFASLDTIILKAGESAYFNVDTLIDLKQLKKQDKNVLQHACEIGKFSYIGQLEDFLFKRIEEAIESAETLSEEVIDILLCR